MHLFKYFILTTWGVSNVAVLHTKFNYLSAGSQVFLYLELCGSKAPGDFDDSGEGSFALRFEWL